MSMGKHRSAHPGITTRSTAWFVVFALAMTFGMSLSHAVTGEGKSEEAKRAAVEQANAEKINTDDYLTVLPGCYHCRIALGYIMKDYRTSCKVEPTVDVQRKIILTPSYQQMVKFVTDTERNESRGRFSNLLPGDKKRAYVMKARFLMENHGCIQ